MRRCDEPAWNVNRMLADRLAWRLGGFVMNRHE
jgi:hypothetical protein